MWLVESIKAKSVGLTRCHGPVLVRRERFAQKGRPSHTGWDPVRARRNITIFDRGGTPPDPLSHSRRDIAMPRFPRSRYTVARSSRVHGKMQRDRGSKPINVSDAVGFIAARCTCPRGQTICASTLQLESRGVLIDFLTRPLRYSCK
jgi:hypothetical protein